MLIYQILTHFLVEIFKFFQPSVHYLGHIVSANAVETHPGKTQALKTRPRPCTLKELKPFLGFSGYYWRCVKDYSHLVKPLTDLTAGYPPLHKHGRTKVKTVQYHNPKETFKKGN